MSFHKILGGVRVGRNSRISPAVASDKPISCDLTMAETSRNV